MLTEAAKDFIFNLGIQNNLENESLNVKEYLLFCDNQAAISLLKSKNEVYSD